MVLSSLVLGTTMIASHYLAMAGTSFFHESAVTSAAVLSGPAYVIPMTSWGSVLFFLVTAYWLSTLIGGRLADADEAVRGGGGASSGRSRPCSMRT